MKPLAAAVLAVSSGSALACATCGCSLSSDAALGYGTDTGWRASLQFDFINQDQLRHGSHAISAEQVAALNDAGGSQEVEHDTVNRYATFGLSYAPNADWSVRIQVPFVDRGHSTYSDNPNPLSPDELSGVRIHGLGDVRLQATWQGLLPDKNLGLQFGVKLPTGRFGGPNADGTGVAGRNPSAFQTGPLSRQPSPGNLVDTSLQPGTGSTDVLLGAFYHEPISADVDAFANVQYQSAFAERLHQAGADFRPGNTTFISFGARYEANSSFIPQVQGNVSHKSADQGALADNPDSQGTVIYLSPGFSASLAQNVQVLGFVQLPVASRLAGYQLAPRWTGSLGVSVGF